MTKTSYSDFEDPKAGQHSFYKFTIDVISLLLVLSVLTFNFHYTQNFINRMTENISSGKNKLLNDRNRRQRPR